MGMILSKAMVSGKVRLTLQLSSDGCSMDVCPVDEDGEQDDYPLTIRGPEEATALATALVAAAVRWKGLREG